MRCCNQSSTKVISPGMVWTSNDIFKSTCLIYKFKPPVAANIVKYSNLMVSISNNQQWNPEQIVWFCVSWVGDGASYSNNCPFITENFVSFIFKIIFICVALIRQPIRCLNWLVDIRE